MLRSSRRLPPFDRHGLVTYRVAEAAGFDCRRLAALVHDGLLVRLRRGVYADALRWHDADPFRAQPILRIRAALLVLRCDPVLSHDSSALMLAMGVPDPVHSLVHITRPKVHGDAVRAGIKHHLAPYAPDEVMRVEGIRVLRPARTALDLAREHGLVAGVAACDQVLRRGLPRDALHTARGRMQCWPHSTVMDDAIAMADGGAETWLESEVRVFLHELGLGPCHTQFGLSDGSTTVFCDLRIGRHVVEVDGALKYADDNPSGLPPREVLRLEKERQDFVTGFKLGMSRVTAHDLRHRDVLGARLLREYADTCGRFGTDVADLAPYLRRR